MKESKAKIKKIKPTRELIRFAWKIETTALRDHKVATTEQSQDRLGNFIGITNVRSTKAETTRSRPKE